MEKKEYVAKISAAAVKQLPKEYHSEIIKRASRIAKATLAGLNEKKLDPIVLELTVEIITKKEFEWYWNSDFYDIRAIAVYNDLYDSIYP